MRKFAKAVAGTLVSAALVAPLAGCSEDVETVPELPDRFCWDVFESKDVSSLLPPGKDVQSYIRPQFLSESSKSATCTLQIDGPARFQASVRRFDFRENIDWSGWEKSEPEPIKIGEEGILWYNGAASYIDCGPSKEESGPGRYVEMDLYAYDQPSTGAEAAENRRILRGLIAQFVTFAQKELRCG
ncbi:hypothetical protein JKV81_25995 [Streptomyces sp. For3]|uniref:hypothetical protein n=1 Tax=Streptomyces TaxID=1883 RepID=UPI00100F3B27|nr:MULTISPECIES: hypothetical protein [Streptomyces]MBL1290280.1 hypothetical protein [Streptomyces silvae]